MYTDWTIWDGVKKGQMDKSGMDIEIVHFVQSGQFANVQSLGQSEIFVQSQKM